MLNVYDLINFTTMNEHAAQNMHTQFSFLKQTYELLKLYLLIIHSIGTCCTKTSLHGKRTPLVVIV